MAASHASFHFGTEPTRKNSISGISQRGLMRSQSPAPSEAPSMTPSAEEQEYWARKRQLMEEEHRANERRKDEESKARIATMKRGRSASASSQSGSSSETSGDDHALDALDMDWLKNTNKLFQDSPSDAAFPGREA